MSRSPVSHRPARARPLLTAEIIAVGSELTAGDTRDTNGPELAEELTRRGVRVAAIQALPDDLEIVATAVRTALGRVDLVLTTGGLGPTPDDLTREAIAAVLGETPSVDADLEAWLRGLFERRRMAMPAVNRKQAWLIPSSHPLANAHGTAPGWWVDRPDGRVIVSLPGPPREMRPMWRVEALPRLLERGLGMEQVTRRLRLTGIGESVVVERLGEGFLRTENPSVATYARPDAVEVRIVGRPEPGEDAARSPERIADDAVALVERRLGDHVFARDEETWGDALERRLRGRSLACVEIGTGGAIAGLVGGEPWFRLGEIARPEHRGDAGGRLEPVDPAREARRVRRRAGAEIGLAVVAMDRRGDTRVSIAVASGGALRRTTRTVFLADEQGRLRAGVAALAFLWSVLGAPS